MTYKDIYTELAVLLTENIERLTWVDLWAEQTSYFEEELPFTLPAVFIEMNADDIEDVGKLNQDINLAVTFHVAVETLAESYQGSYNQGSALEILDLLVELHKLLHGKSGENFSRMSRKNQRHEINGNNIQQYAVTYNTMVRDSSAEKEYQKLDNLNFIIEKE